MLYVIRRLFRIGFVLLKYGLDQELVPCIFSASYALKVFPTYRKLQSLPIGERYFHACCELGPLMVKLGQMISIRHDLFPCEIVAPLSKLQDQVPPFCNTEAISLIEKELGQTLDQLFDCFNPKPIASASIAQVYEARLKNKATVVVKVVRPKVKETIKTDIRLLGRLIKLFCFLNRISPSDLLSLINEYDYTLKQEIDLKNEACHYSQMRHFFEDDDRLYVPKIIWSHTTSSVAVIEKVIGVPIDEVADIPGINLKKLAYNGVSIFFAQVFKHRFFHADMHPGNVFVDITDRENPKYMAIDFGIVGVLSPTDQYYLAENFLAFFKRDYTRIAHLHVEAGWVCEHTNLVKLESAIRHVCEPIFAKTIEEISIAQLMYRLVEVSKPFDLKLQPQLLLLQKTLFHVEALGRKLYPQMNLWEAAEPFLTDFMKQRASIKSGWEGLKQELPRLMSISPKLPFLLTRKLLNDTPIAQEPRSMVPAMFYGIVIGTLLTKPDYLTSPGVIYMMGVSLIIMIAWKFIK